MHYLSYYTSPLGELTLASDGEALVGLWFAGQKYYGSTLEAAREEAELEVFTQAKLWLDCYFKQQPLPKLPLLRPQGGAFRQSVWRILQTIPLGATMTYGEIAAELERASGRRMSAQAVGGAVGHNPLGIFIPCHRVLGSKGQLTGYAGGIEKKLWLLQLEGISIKF